METATQENAVLYEISFFQKAEEDDTVKKAIVAAGGAVLEEKPMVKVRFSYPIKKETQGFMGIVRFRMEGDALPALSGALNLEKEILRFMVTRSEHGGEVVTDEEKGKRRMQRKTSLREPKKGFAAALSNEALEKKIEEISQ